MRKLMPYVAALGAAPIVAIAVTLAAAPAFADTPGVSPTCFPQTMNPHPTDPAGQTAGTLFCTPANSNGSGSGGSGSGSSGGSGGSTTTGAGTTAGGGGQTSFANSTGSGTGSFPDESGHFARGLGGTWSGSGLAAPAASNNTGLFGGLVGFFSSAGGLVSLFGLLMLMLIALIALAVIAALRRSGKDFASRFSRVTYRAQS
jgi:hypothetical protein